MQRLSTDSPAPWGGDTHVRASPVVPDGEGTHKVRKVPWPLSFGLLAIIWGCSFWWIKESLTFLTPLQVALTRCALGAIVLALVVVITKTRFPARPVWKHLVVVALLLNSVPFTLFAFGQTHVSSILAGIINATTPLWTLLVTLVAFPDERPTRQRVVGLALGFMGVLVLLGVWLSIPTGQVIGIAACLGATLCYGIAFPYARRFIAPSNTPPVSLAAGQVALGAAFLLPIAVLEWSVNPAPLNGITSSGLLAILALGALGSGLAYVLNYSVIAATSSSTAASVTYLTPVVAVAVGLAILGESLTWYEPVGAAIILLGVAVGQGRIRLPARAAVPAE